VYENHPDDFVKRFSRLEGNKAFSEVTFLLGNEGEESEEHPLHRCILSARSSHFKSMFSLGLREAEEKIITLHELPPAIFAKVMAKSLPNLQISYLSF